MHFCGSAAPWLTPTPLCNSVLLRFSPTWLFCTPFTPGTTCNVPVTRHDKMHGVAYYLPKRSTCVLCVLINSSASRIYASHPFIALPICFNPVYLRREPPCAYHSLFATLDGCQASGCLRCVPGTKVVFFLLVFVSSAERSYSVLGRACVNYSALDRASLCVLPVYSSARPPPLSFTEKLLMLYFRCPVYLHLGLFSSRLVHTLFTFVPVQKVTINILNQ